MIIAPGCQRGWNQRRHRLRIKRWTEPVMLVPPPPPWLRSRRSTARAWRGPIRHAAEPQDRPDSARRRTRAPAFYRGGLPGRSRAAAAKDRIAWRPLQAPRPTSTRNAGWSRMAPSTGKHHSVDHVKVVTGLPYRPQDALGKPRERAFIPWVIHRVIQRYVDNMRAFLQKCRSFPDPGQRRGVSCPATALAGCGGLEQQAPHAAAAPRIT